MRLYQRQKRSRPTLRKFDAWVETVGSALDSTLNRSLARSRLSCSQETCIFVEMHHHSATDIAKFLQVEKKSAY
jgi:hypothetical protein